ncbi:MAG: NAD(P)-dependent oxidoreductase [Polyangiaceae bacterium]|nr:NAD(P)-dependent oxidoreductase [Polyangiaceae bacterium]
MKQRILVTGGSGVVGRALRQALEASGNETVNLDLAAQGVENGDIRHAERVHSALSDCAGVIHLAAISRVGCAEHNPNECLSTNVEGTRTVLHVASSASHRPWVLFVSSREVYGNPSNLPVVEGAPLSPVNVYGRSKVEGERLVERAARDGLRTGIVRLTNVMGSPSDQPDRVIPSFIRAATTGKQLRVNGPNRRFDFVHVTDVVRGLVAYVALFSGSKASLPTVHLASGRGVSLGHLAEVVVRATRSTSSVRFADTAPTDVQTFVGDPTQASQLLGWKSTITVEQCVESLVPRSQHRINPEVNES